MCSASMSRQEVIGLSRLVHQSAHGIATGSCLRRLHDSRCYASHRLGHGSFVAQQADSDGLLRGTATYTWGNSTSSRPSKPSHTWLKTQGRSFAIVADSRKATKGTVVLVDKHLSTASATLEKEAFMPDFALNAAIRGANGQAVGGAKTRVHRQANSWQYAIPRSYGELLDKVRDGSPSTPGVADLNVHSPSQGSSSEKFDGKAGASEVQTLEPNASDSDDAREKFSFWPAARKLALSRLRSLETDLEPWEFRAAKLHESLWVEELSIELEMLKLRLTVDVLPVVGDDLYKLDITSLSDATNVPLDEKGIFRGVNVLITCSSHGKFKATVQPGSGGGSLLLSSSASLANAIGPFEVEFHPHRFQQLAMHRALDASQNSQFLRAASDETDQLSALPIDSSANNLPASLNEDQRRAVAAVLGATSKRPLVIWGPPGTGKTTLAAFIIWHMVQERGSNLHILAVAPSNTGADVICSKLGKLGLDPERVLRLNALGRNVNTVPDDIRRFCHYTTGEHGRTTFGVPSLSKAREFKVIVTTCIASTHLVNALRSEGSSGWFSHVIVDEAGEATEPETLVPLSLIRPIAGVTVLLGDHFQLGPLVMSRLASQIASLETSMIERLANERFSEARDDGERSGLSRDTLLACEDHGLFFLTNSYRSHPAITQMYSDIFYASQLEHCARPQQLTVLPFFEARGLQAPVIFHNIVGQERRDSDSPSVYNVDELRIVQQYLVDLLGDARLGINASDIGIITPYTKQLQALQQQIESLGPTFTGVECGTVEWFQGQERRVVIMSTVRCSKLADGSVAHAGATRRPIGFVADPKRLNVAISRAVAGLIVVGDLRTLAAHSSHWRLLLEQAQELGAVHGDPLVDTLPEAFPEAASTVSMTGASAAWDALTDT